MSRTVWYCLAAALTALAVYDYLQEEGYHLVLLIGRGRTCDRIERRLLTPESPGDAAAVAAKEAPGA